MRTFLESSDSFDDAYSGSAIEINTHHRIPKSQTKDRKGRFAIKINAEMHRYWHFMSQNLSPANLAKVLNLCIYKNNYYKIICERRKNNVRYKYYEIDYTNQKSISDIDLDDVIYYFYKMFNNKNVFDICRIINRYFLDPNWRLFPKHIKKRCNIRKQYSIKKI